MDDSTVSSWMAGEGSSFSGSPMRSADMQRQHTKLEALDKLEVDLSQKLDFAQREKATMQVAA